jgi:polysaccharide biosynthesis protein PslH
MNYRPNIEGVYWFVHQVWPGLKQQVPDLRFVIVGRDPTPRVRELAGQPGVSVTGSVPDVRPYLAAASVAVVPLQIARGVQNKILEAMAMARAVVASPAAIEGLDVEVGRDLIQAGEPRQWQENIVALLTNDDHRRQVEQSARARVAGGSDWPARMAPLLSLCERLMAGAAIPQSPSGVLNSGLRAAMAAGKP